MSIFLSKLSFVGYAFLILIMLAKTALGLDLFVYKTPVGFLCYFTYFGRHKKFYIVFGRPLVKFTTGLEV